MFCRNMKDGAVCGDGTDAQTDGQTHGSGYSSRDVCIYVNNSLFLPIQPLCNPMGPNIEVAILDFQQKIDGRGHIGCDPTGS